MLADALKEEWENIEKVRTIFIRIVRLALAERDSKLPSTTAKEL
jgi:hypothetical protein